MLMGGGAAGPFFPQLLRDLARFREPAGLLLREDVPAVHDDFEDAAGAGDEGGVGTQLRF